MGFGFLSFCTRAVTCEVLYRDCFHLSVPRKCVAWQRNCQNGMWKQENFWDSASSVASSSGGRWYYVTIWSSYLLDLCLLLPLKVQDSANSIWAVIVGGFYITWIVISLCTLQT